MFLSGRLLGRASQSGQAREIGPFVSTERLVRKNCKRAHVTARKIRRMEIYQLKTFVAVAAEGNLTRAAERVFTSPPAVSAQLKSLEDELGVQLFERSSRGMTLTAAGERLLAQAQRTLAAAQAMQSEAAQLRGQARGLVRMGTVSDPVALRLGDVFVRLAERHPHVALQLQQGISMRAAQAVRRGELDCAFVLLDTEAIDGMELLRLQPCEVVAVLPQRLVGQGDLPTLHELVRLPWVSNPAECGLRRQLERLFDSAGEPLPVGTMADTEGAVRGMVAAGLGVGLMRRDQAEGLEREGLGQIWPHWCARTWLAWISTPAALEVPAVAAVREAVAESFVVRATG